MTLRPDPFTEIREALERERTQALRGGFGCRHLTRALEALATVEREAAERETAHYEALRQAERDALAESETLLAKLADLEAYARGLGGACEHLRGRVREVEAERDRLAGCSNLKHFLAMRTRAEAAEATVARQAGVLRVEPLAKMIADWLVEWADDESTDERFRRLSRYPIPSWAESEKLAERIIAAVLASPEAAAAEPERSVPGVYGRLPGVPNSAVEPGDFLD